MTALVLALSFASFHSLATERDGLSREQLTDALKSLHAPIHDFEFRYEGKFDRLRELDLSTLPEPMRRAAERHGTDDGSTTYQGTIAYRDDDSVHLDLYDRPDDPDVPLKREITCLFRGKVSRRTLVPDRGGPMGPDTSKPGHILGLMMGKTALWICRGPLIEAYLRNKETIGYEFVDWEEIDGHECAVVEFFGVSAREPDKRVWSDKYWIDLERGGHALRVEKYSEGSLAAKAFDIQLAQVQTDDGMTVWFPISGVYETYGIGLFTYSRSPVTRQKSEVLRGSLRINQGLRDARFTLDWNLSPSERPSTSRNRNAITSRSESADQLVKEALEKADAQSPELVATSPARRGWFARNALAIGIFSVGLVVLIATRYLKQRS